MSFLLKNTAHTNWCKRRASEATEVVKNSCWRSPGRSVLIMEPRSYHLPRTELAQYLGHQGQQAGNQHMVSSPDKATIVRGIRHGHFVFQDLITRLSPGKRRLQPLRNRMILPASMSSRWAPGSAAGIPACPTPWRQRATPRSPFVTNEGP